METRGTKRRRDEEDTGSRELPPTSAAAAARDCLRNPLILSQIATHLPPAAILKSRRLSPAVNTAFLPSLRVTHEPIRIYGSSLSNSNGLVNLLALHHHENQLPFIRLQFDRHALDVNGASPHPIFNLIGHWISSLELTATLESAPIPLIHSLVFDKTGPSLRNLTLHLTTTSVPEDESHEQSSVLLPNFNLKRFELKVSLGSRSGVPISLRRFSASSLHSKCTWSHRDCSNQKRDWVKTPGGEWQHATTFVCPGIRLGSAPPHFRPHNQDVTQTTLRLLIQLADGRNSSRLAPKSITTSFIFHTQTHVAEWNQIASLLYDFLNTQASTLLQLKLQVSCEQPRRLRVVAVKIHAPHLALAHLRSLTPAPVSHRTALIETVKIRLPHMARLHSFSLVPLEGKYHKLGIQFELSTIEVNFPNLTKFECNTKHGFSGGILDQFRNTAVLSHSNITTLQLEQFTWKMEQFTTLGNLYPSVKHVQLRLLCSNSDALWKCTSIWSAWPQLDTLDVQIETRCECRQTLILEWDEWVTGIPRERFAQVNMSLKRLVAAPDQLHALLRVQRKYKTRPGLPDLRHLRSCSIKMFYTYSGECQWGRVTDIGGYLGFALASPSLQELHLRSHNRGMLRVDYPHSYRGNELSPACQALIRTSLGPNAAIDIL